MSTTISRWVEGAGLSRQDFQIPGSTDSAGESSHLRYLSLTWAIFDLWLRAGEIFAAQNRLGITHVE